MANFVTDTLLEFFLFKTYRETVDETGWSTLYSAPMYNSNGSSFLLHAPLRDGDFGSFRHVALVETARTHLVHPITFGRFEVEEIIAWDEDEGIVWVELKRRASLPVWPDGYIIIIQSLTIYNNDNLPSSIKMTKLLKRLTNTK